MSEYNVKGPNRYSTGRASEGMVFVPGSTPPKGFTSKVNTSNPFSVKVQKVQSTKWPQHYKREWPEDEEIDDTNIDSSPEYGADPHKNETIPENSALQEESQSDDDTNERYISKVKKKERVNTGTKHFQVRETYLASGRGESTNIIIPKTSSKRSVSNSSQKKLRKTSSLSSKRI